MATPSSKADDDSCCSGISIDDVAFAVVDFTGVDFGGDDDDEDYEKKAQEESAKGSPALNNRVSTSNNIRNKENMVCSAATN